MKKIADAYDNITSATTRSCKIVIVSRGKMYAFLAAKEVNNIAL